MASSLSDQHPRHGPAQTCLSHMQLCPPHLQQVCHHLTPSWCRHQHCGELSALLPCRAASLLHRRRCARRRSSRSSNDWQEPPVRVACDHFKAASSKLADHLVAGGAPAPAPRFCVHGCVGQQLVRTAGASGMQRLVERRATRDSSGWGRPSAGDASSDRERQCRIGSRPLRLPFRFGYGCRHGAWIIVKLELDWASVKLGFHVQHVHGDGTFNTGGTHNKSRIRPTCQ
uniref:Uncharacterized protein n=1 Tax=Setaria italica TaxID=4555 RepID=K3YVH4_SETIT